MRIISSLFAVCAAVVLAVDPAFAETVATTGGSDFPKFGAALGLGIAALGGAIGQGRIMGSTVESIARNPGAAGQLFLPWLLGLIFVESLVIYAMVIAFKLIG